MRHFIERYGDLVVDGAISTAGLALMVFAPLPFNVVGVILVGGGLVALAEDLRA